MCPKVEQSLSESSQKKGGQVPKFGAKIEKKFAVKKNFQKHFFIFKKKTFFLFYFQIYFL